MKQRILTTFITLMVFVPVILAGNWLMKILLTIVAVIALMELLYMKKIPILSFPSVISSAGLILMILSEVDLQHELNFFTERVMIFIALLLLIYTVFSENRFSVEDAAFTLFGTIYIGAGFRSFILIRHTGIHLLLLILFVVWSTDTFAYLIGRKIGKRKLAPAISPNKTIEGSLGGTLSAMAVASVYLMFVDFQHSFVYMLFMMFILSISGQLGDLAESAIKRYYGVKDSGKILPGHGGFLDRFDSLLFAMTFAVLLNLI